MSLILTMVNKNQYYDYSSIVRKPGFSAPTHRVFVIYDRFLDIWRKFYSVDSYSNSEYKIIPTIWQYKFKNVLDFRPIVAEVLSGSGSVASPFTINSLRVFDFLNRSFTGNQVGLPGQGDTTIMSPSIILVELTKYF